LYSTKNLSPFTVSLVSLPLNGFPFFFIAFPFSNFPPIFLNSSNDKSCTLPFLTAIAIAAIALITKPMLNIIFDLEFFLFLFESSKVS